MAVENSLEPQGVQGITEREVEPQCRLLRLPAELRNRIYELAFTTNADAQTPPFDLLKAKGPDKALLSTCRQIGEEAQAFWDTALPQYWENTSFFIDGRRGFWHDPSDPIQQIQALEDADIKRITKLEIRGHDARYHFNNGIWSCVGACCNESGSIATPNSRRCPRMMVLMPGHPRVVRLMNLSTTFVGHALTDSGNGSCQFCWLEIAPEKDAKGEVAKTEIGWKFLTKAELIHMVVRYEGMSRRDRKILGHSVLEGRSRRRPKV